MTIATIQYPSADASIDENLRLMHDGFSDLPGFTAVKQDGLHIGIEDPDFGVVGVCCRSPDSTERSERASGYLKLKLKLKKK